MKLKRFKLFDAILAMVCVILVTEACAPTAAIGNSQYFWWIFLLICFFVPYGLISCELGTTYKDENGIFSWVKKAFGAKWASRVSFYYWINFPIWIVSITVLVVSLLELVFNITFPLVLRILIEILFVTLVCVLGNTRLSKHKKIINFGTIIKVILMGGLGIFGIYTAINKGSATEFTLKSFLPEFNMNSLTYLSVIVFNFIGFEIVATFRKQVTNPKKQFPKIVLISGILIAVFYMLTSFGLSVAIPKENLSLDTGLIESYQILFGIDNGVWLSLIAIMFIITLFVSLLSWTEGVNLQCVASSKDKGMPKVFGYKDKKGRLIGASMMTWIVSILIILIEPFIKNDVFWSFFALNLVTTLLTYMPMFLAFKELRTIDKDIERPYMVPGNNFVVNLITYIPTIILIVSLFLTILPSNLSYSALIDNVPIMIGTILTMIIGEIFVYKVK